MRQQALRGLAKIALQRGERDLAKAQYERILGKALLGRGQPAEHWAHAEYAWLQFGDHDLHVSSLPGCLSSPCLPAPSFTWWEHIWETLSAYKT